MKEILALAAKDLRLLLRDRAGLFFTFFFPLGFAVFFGIVLSGRKGGSALSILVVDEDQTRESRRFIAALQAAPELEVRLSRREEAVESVRRGEHVACVVLRRGFGEARKRLFWGEPPAVELGVDPARRAEAGMLRGILARYAAEEFQKVLTDPAERNAWIREATRAVRGSSGLSDERRRDLLEFLDRLAGVMAATSPTGRNGVMRGWQPVVVEETGITREQRAPRNAYAVSFPQGVIWGILGCTAAFGVSLVSERTRGTLARLRMAPVTRWQILAGKGLACFLATVSVSAALFMIGMLFFGVRPDSIALLGMGILAISIAFVGIMVFLSVLGKTERSASGMSWAVLLAMTMLGGGMIPLFVMPPWMQDLSNISPVKWAVLAMEGAVWRRFSFLEMLPPCGILTAVGLVFFSIGVRAFRWTVQS